MLVPLLSSHFAFDMITELTSRLSLTRRLQRRSKQQLLIARILDAFNETKPFKEYNLLGGVRVSQ